MRVRSIGSSAVGQSGFSLIDALIAVVVLATGFLALTALQSALTRSSADAKARSLLANHAQAVLDAARIQGVGSLSSTTTAVSETVLPGRLAEIGSAMGATSLTESSTVTDLAGSANFKRIDLVFNWRDAAGTSRRLGMSTVVSPLVLASSPLNDIPPPSAGLDKRPIVRRPTPYTDGMIPIALGDGQDTAATNPKPQLAGRDSGTLVADTRFDVLTYGTNSADSLGVDGIVRFNKRIETAMVGCTCQSGDSGFPTGGSSPEVNALLKEKAFRPSYWDGERYVDPAPATYAVGRSPNTSASQSKLCDVCCRDHEDDRDTGSGARFNPWLASGGDHRHYQDPAGSAVTSGTFREACRVVRVNGIWRVTPDPKLMDLALVPTNTFGAANEAIAAPLDNGRADTPAISDLGRARYLAFAYDFIRDYFYEPGEAVDAQSLQASHGLNGGDPGRDYVSIGGGVTRWLHSRGILVDKLEQSALDKITQARASCPSATGAVAQAQCVIPAIPMASVNTTEIANWGAGEVSQTNIIHSGTLALAATLKNYALSVMNRFVSAFALVGPISPTDDDNPLMDEQTFALRPLVTRTGAWLSVASPAGVLFGDPLNPRRGFARIGGGTSFNATLAGLVSATNNEPGDDPTVNVGVSSPAPCNPVNLVRGGNPFACTSDSATNVEIAFGNFNTLNTTGGNIKDPCNADSRDKIGEGQGTCRAYTVAGSTLVSGTVGRISEVRSVILPSVTAGSTYTITFAGPTTTDATAVCAAGQWQRWSCD